MDGQRFDQITKALATTTSRRQMVRLLAAGAVSGLLAALGSGDADAKGCKRAEKRCKKHSQCCSGVCRPDGTCGCASDVDCNDRNACTVGVCGPESRTCHQVEIDGCVQCHNDGDCAGGTCCEGRCCAAGATCGRAPAGEPICSRDCEGDVCFDTIEHGGNGQLVMSSTSCASRPAACASCPAVCVSLGNCQYVPFADAPCGCELQCVAPVSQWT